MNVIEIEGDLITLFEQEILDVIAHGCNCQCTMGSGIARKIRDKYPEVYNLDLRTEKGDINKLGNYTTAEINRTNKPGKIYNLYTQYNYGNDDALYLIYPAIELALRKMIFLEKDKKIGLPQIGCKQAGGDWNIVKKMIEDYANKYKADVTIVYFK